MIHPASVRNKYSLELVCASKQHLREKPKCFSGFRFAAQLSQSLLFDTADRVLGYRILPSHRNWPCCCVVVIVQALIHITSARRLHLLGSTFLLVLPCLCPFYTQKCLKCSHHPSFERFGFSSEIQSREREDCCPPPLFLLPMSPHKKFPSSTSEYPTSYFYTLSLLHVRRI